MKNRGFCDPICQHDVRFEVCGCNFNATEISNSKLYLFIGTSHCTEKELQMLTAREKKTEFKL